MERHPQSWQGPNPSPYDPRGPNQEPCLMNSLELASCSGGSQTDFGEIMRSTLFLVFSLAWLSTTLGCESLKQMGTAYLQDQETETTPQTLTDEPQPGQATLGQDPSVMFSMLAPHPERAETNPVEGPDAGQEFFSTQLVGFEAIKQEQSNWCWAACAQMVRKFVSQEDVSQGEIAAATFGVDEQGEAQNMAANQYQVFCALNPDMTPIIPFGTIWSGISEAVLQNPAVLHDPKVRLDRIHLAEASINRFAPITHLSIDDLRNGYPIVVGLPSLPNGDGHAWVVVGAKYKRTSAQLETATSAITQDIKELIDPKLGIEGATDVAIERFAPDRYEISEVTVVNPANAQIEVMTYNEFQSSLEFAINPSESREQLANWRASCGFKQEQVR